MLTQNCFNSIYLGLFCAVASALPTQAASFDCRRAATRIERLICSDKQLSRFDGTLAALYRAGLERTHNSPRLIVSQRAWLAARDACASQVSARSCVVDAYQQRGDVLNQYGPNQDVTPFCPGC